MTESAVFDNLLPILLIIVAIGRRWCVGCMKKLSIRCDKGPC